MVVADPFKQRRRNLDHKTAKAQAPKYNADKNYRQAAKNAFKKLGPGKNVTDYAAHAIATSKQQKRIKSKIKKRGVIPRVATQKKNRYPDKNAKGVPVITYHRRPPAKTRRAVIRGDGRN